MSMLADHIISMQIDLEEARDFFSEQDQPKMIANLLHLRDTANKALLMFPPTKPETTEPSNTDGKV